MVDQRRLLVLSLKRVDLSVLRLPSWPRTVLNLKPAALSCSGVAVAKLMPVVVVLFMVVCLLSTIL